MDEKHQSLELIGPASPESLIPDVAFPWWWIVAALLLLAAVIVVVIRLKSTPTKPRHLRDTAFSEASIALSQIQTGDTQNAAIQASLILRKYLSIVTHDPALFETHEEFISRQDSLNKLTTDARSTAEAGFTRLAALKYSPVSPSVSESEIIDDSQKILTSLHQGFIA